MNMVNVLFKREFAGFFATPVAYVFILIFLMLSGVFTFYIGNFFEREQADLLPFFNFHPWLYLFLVPAMAMRTWSEERKSGTIELLMTLPVTTWQITLAKFLAAWAVLGLSLILTFPLWLTVNYLGQPDNGIILAAYIGSWLMSGAYLAIGICMSAITKSQVIAFILSVVICFLFVLSGSGVVLEAFQGWLPTILVDTIASFSFLTHFESMSKGVLAMNNLMYFLISIGVWLFASLLIIEQKKAD